MSKRANLWLKFSHLLPPEKVWQRIGNPVRVADGYAFIVSMQSKLMPGRRVHMMMRYDEKQGVLVQAGDRGRDYTFSDSKAARDALIHYQAQEGAK